MRYDSLPDRSARFTFAPPGIVRMTCECCGHPTLPLMSDTGIADVDWEGSHLGCILCDWESGPALEDGTPDPAAASAEDRNGGCGLTEARANYERYGWMYDPARPPEWMGGLPTPEELDHRRALRQAYEVLAAAPERRARGDAWDAVVAMEAQLRATEEARRAALESTIDPDEEEWGVEDDRPVA